MNMFLDFLSDNTFFAIFSGVIIVLVLAFIITLVKGKKDIKNPENEEKLDNYQVQTSSVDESVIENNEVNSFENTLMGSNSPDTGYQAAFTNYVPDLNENEVNNIDIPSTPVDTFEEVPFKEPILPDVKEIKQNDIPDAPAIEIPAIMPSVEVPTIKEEENKEVINDVIPDFVESNEKVSVEPIKEEANEEMEIPIPIVESPGLAFDSKPSEDSFINENIKIDPVDEYDIEKTEIFDFPDFSKTEIDSKTALIDVESAVMEAANKYIESVMKS